MVGDKIITASILYGLIKSKSQTEIQHTNRVSTADPQKRSDGSSSRA